MASGPDLSNQWAYMTKDEATRCAHCHRPLWRRSPQGEKNAEGKALGYEPKTKRDEKGKKICSISTTCHRQAEWAKAKLTEMKEEKKDLTEPLESDAAVSTGTEIIPVRKIHESVNVVHDQPDDDVGQNRSEGQVDDFVAALLWI